MFLFQYFLSSILNRYIVDSRPLFLVQNLFGLKRRIFSIFLHSFFFLFVLLLREFKGLLRIFTNSTISPLRPFLERRMTPALYIWHGRYFWGCVVLLILPKRRFWFWQRRFTLVAYFLSLPCHIGFKVDVFRCDCILFIFFGFTFTKGYLNWTFLLAEVLKSGQCLHKLRSRDRIDQLIHVFAHLILKVIKL